MQSESDKGLHCALSGKELSLGEEVFFAASPDGILIVDINKELPSKHVCIECRFDAINKAVESGIFQDAFGGDLKIPPDFADKILLLLHKKGQGMLSMARKSGLLVFGYEKVNASIKAGDADFILKASDGKSDTKHKTGLNAGFLRISGVFTSIELGGVIGRGRVVHMAVLKGNIKLSEKIAAILTKIENFKD